MSTPLTLDNWATIPRSSRTCGKDQRTLRGSLRSRSSDSFERYLRSCFRSTGFENQLTSLYLSHFSGGIVRWRSSCEPTTDLETMHTFFDMDEPFQKMSRTNIQSKSAT